MSEGQSIIDTMITLDKDADYNGDNLVELCELLLAEIKEFREERVGLDINDGFGDYLEGLISARQTVLGRLGVPLEVYMDGDC
jgi:type I restriction-modification system DNA methylase subunit